MLTTKDSRDIAENIISDVNANVPSPTPNRQRVLSPEAALLLNKSLVARPLMVPEVCSLHIKNTEYRYRWVNKGSQGGRIYQQRKAQGFINATSEDAEVLNGDAVSDKGEITAGDLILMKIRADLYDAAIKHNMVKALAFQNTRGMHLSGASSDVYSDSTPRYETISESSGARTALAKPFIPDNADDIVNKAAGSLDELRQRDADTREKISAEKKSARS